MGRVGERSGRNESDDADAAFQPRSRAFFKRVQGRTAASARIERAPSRRLPPLGAGLRLHLRRVAAEGRRHAVEIINAEQRPRARSRRRHRPVAARLRAGTSRSSASTCRRRCSRRRASASTPRTLGNITGLHEMDASDLKFPDASFDTVVAMYVMTVVPEPEKVMRELSRVAKPGRRGDARQPLQPATRACAAGSSGGWRRSPTSSAGARCSISRASWCATTWSWSSARRCALGPVHDDALRQARRCRPPSRMRRERIIAVAPRDCARILDSSTARSL